MIGVVPDGLPSIQIPQIDLMQLINLGTVAIVISLIGFMEAISISKAMATKTKHRLDADQELIGQGLSNIVSSFFQAEDGIRDQPRSRGLGDVYKRQEKVGRIIQTVITLSLIHI